MKLKASQIIEIVIALNNLANKELPLTLAIDVANVIDALETPYNQITKKRDELVKKFSEKKEDGEVAIQENGMIKILDYQSFQIQETELLDTEIKLDLISINMDALKQCDIQISPKDFRALKPIIERK